MRHLHVYFNNLVGVGVLPVPSHGQSLTTGEHIAAPYEGTCLTANSLLDGADWSTEPQLRPANDEAVA